MMSDRRPTINLNDGQPLRVRLISTRDPYSRLEPGAEGTAQFIDGVGTLHVNWDSGERLGLIVNEDSWTWVDPGFDQLVAELEQTMRFRSHDKLTDDGYSFS